MKILICFCQFLFVSIHLINVVLSIEEVLPNFNKDQGFLNPKTSYSLEKLNELLKKIDSNKNLQITREELIEWMLKLSLIDLDRRASSDIKYYDLDKNGKVAWAEMLQTTYGYTEEEVENIVNSKDPVDNDNYNYIIEDRNRFLAADVDSDGLLTSEEYKSLLNPLKNEKLMKLSIDKIMSKNDFNKDSELDENEFKLYFYLTENLTNTQLEEFTSIFLKYDFNKDRKLSIEELKSWYAPDITIAAKFEADDLISKTDANNDQVLTFDEIRTKLDDWTISHATDYGRHIKDEL